MRPNRALLFAVILALGLCACGKSHEETAEALAEQALQASTGAEIDIQDANGVHRVTARTEQGEMVHSTGDNVPLPEGFPSDITLPADYRVMSVMTMGDSTSIVMRSPEPVTENFLRIREGQAAGGWTETLSIQGADGSTLGFEKAGRQVLVNLRDDQEGKSVVSLSLKVAD
ncbi:hypothetical protein [Arenimonas alkanexedens]